MKTRFELILICFVTVILIGCASVPPAPIVIHGMVYDSNNQPAGNYQVFLDGKRVGTTDIGGRFDIEVKPGNYYLTGNGAGYGSIEQAISLYNQKQTLYIRVETINEVLEKAVIAMEDGRPDTAVLLLAPCLSANSTNYDVLYVLTSGYILCGDRAHAEEIFSLLEEIPPRDDVILLLKKLLYK